MIEIHQFHKAYDNAIAARGITFRVAGGEILGLVGPNGAGKTTTLRALAGIISPSQGNLQVAGFDVQRQPLEAKRRLAYVPDDPQLFRDLTVEQHLAFAASAYQVHDADAKASLLLESFELHDKRHSMAGDLSRGMRQKLAVCCAYLHDPEVILFDEPLTGLDPHGIRTLKKSIVQRAGAGAAVIVSSHLLAMVEDICSHVLILHRGQQRFFGRLEQLRSQFRERVQDASLEEIFFHATCEEPHSAIST